MYRQRKYAHFAYLIVDILLICLSFYLPYSLKYNRSIIAGDLLYFRDYCLLFFLWGLSLVFILNNHHLYSTNRSLTIIKESWLVTKCVIFASILAGLAVFLLKLDFFSRFVFALATVFLILSLSLWRALKRIIVRHLIAHGYYNINILVVGAGSAGCTLVEEIKNNPYLGLNLIGFVDDNKNGRVLNYDILGKIEDLGNLIQQYFIDDIYVTIPSQRKKVSEILAIGRRFKKTVRVLVDNFTLPFAKPGLNYIGLVPIIVYSDLGLNSPESFIKRGSDFILATVGLILLSPLFLLIAILIKLDSRGPVFYECVRCGKKGRLFNFYKFRSMVDDAENHKEDLRHKSDVKGPVFKIKDDPRTTRLGRFLRRYSLDELPQLFNVIKGDMSLVGPRPPTADEVEKYDLWQMRRLNVRPGITCLWQVRGRSDLSFYKWMKWDLWYIDNWSLGLDLQILLWTIPVVLKKKGAY